MNPNEAWSSHLSINRDWACALEDVVYDETCKLELHADVIDPGSTGELFAGKETVQIGVFIIYLCKCNFNYFNKMVERFYTIGASFFWSTVSGIAGLEIW